MATQIQKISEGVYDVDNIWVYLHKEQDGSFSIPNDIRYHLSIAQVVALKSFRKAESDNLKIQSTIKE